LRSGCAKQFYRPPRSCTSCHRLVRPRDADALRPVQPCAGRPGAAGLSPPRGPQAALGRPGAGLTSSLLAGWRPGGLNTWGSLRIASLRDRETRTLFALRLQPCAGRAQLPEGAAGRLGAARRRLDLFGAGQLEAWRPQNLGAHFVSHTAPRGGGPQRSRIAGHCTSRTTRLFRGWVGRALLGNSLENRRSCSGLRVTGVFSTSQSTPSVQGGVVSEPRNW